MTIAPSTCNRSLENPSMPTNVLMTHIAGPAGQWISVPERLGTPRAA
jgi:hypothetical protein